MTVTDYRLLTAEILYHMPDHPSLLQTYVWQQLDIAPDFPELHSFLEYWQRHLEGKLHSVCIADVKLVSPQDYQYFSNGFTVH